MIAVTRSASRLGRVESLVEHEGKDRHHQQIACSEDELADDVASVGGVTLEHHEGGEGVRQGRHVRSSSCVRYAPVRLWPLRRTRA